MKQAVRFCSEPTIRVERSAKFDAPQGTGPVPGQPISFDEYGQAARSDARHVLDEPPLVAGEQGAVGAIEVDAKQTDPPPQTVIQPGPLPTCVDQPAVGHHGRIDVAGQVEGQAAERRSIEFAGVETGGRQGRAFVGLAGCIAHKGDLIPRLGRNNRIEGRLIAGAAAVAHTVGNLPDVRPLDGHFKNVPRIGGRSFGSEKQPCPVKGNRRIAGAVELPGQYAGKMIGTNKHDPCFVAIGGPKHPICHECIHLRSRRQRKLRGDKLPVQPDPRSGGLRHLPSRSEAGEVAPHCEGKRTEDRKAPTSGSMINRT